MKKLLLLVSSASALILSGLIFAQTPPAGNTSQQGAGQAGAASSSDFADLEQSLEVYLNGLSKVTWEHIRKHNHAYDQNTPSYIALNNISIPVASIFPSGQNTASQTQYSLGQAVEAQAQTHTNNNIRNSLLEFNYSLNQSASDQNVTTAEGQPYQQYLQDNSIQNLILGPNAQADDSLYLTGTSALTSLTGTDPNNQKLLSPPSPSAIDNGQFSFNMIATTSYTQPQQNEVHRFLKYFTLNTQSLLGPITFSALHGNAKALLSLKQSNDYQKFMLNIRNLLTTRSVFLYNLNYLIAERTPLPNLGSVIGQSGSASPLQVEEYRATHDLNSPDWFTSLQYVQPATVQRQILITLKEIERQNFEAKMQNERLISVLLAMGMQSNATSTESLKLEQQKLETAIKNAGKSSTTTAGSDASGPGGLSSNIVVTPTTNSASIAWGGVTNAKGTVKYSVTVTNTATNQTTATEKTTAAAGTGASVNVAGLTPGTNYSVSVTPNQGSGAQSTFQTKGTAPSTTPGKNT